MSAKPSDLKRGRRQSLRRARSRIVARRPRLLGFEPLEDRTMLAITVAIPVSNAAPPWTDLGPDQIQNGQVLGMSLQNNPVAGAVVAFATAESFTNASTVAFAATANGGVWETNNLNATTPVDVNQVNDPFLLAAPGIDISDGTNDGGASGTGPFNYKITNLLPGGVETNATPPIPLMGNKSGIVQINVPADDFSKGIVGRNIYRAVKVNNVTTYWLVGMIPGNSAGNLIDDTDPTKVDITKSNPMTGFVAQNRVVQEPSPQWQALTDGFPTLSMQSIVIDPSDPYRAFAGTGQASASRQNGTGQGIIMMTVDPADSDNNTATLIGADTFSGLNISAIQVLPNNRLLVASNDADQGGVFLSSNYTQNNVTFTRVNNNLPKGPVTDLAFIPAAATPTGAGDLILAAVATGDSNAGIYVNTASGLAETKSTNWTLTTKNVPTQTGSNYKFANAILMHLSVWTDTNNHNNTVYADTVESVAEGPDQETAGTAVTQVFRIDNVTAAPITAGWNVVSGAGKLPVPALIEGGINPGGEGGFNSPIVADPTDRNIFYVAGDRPPIPDDNTPIAQLKLNQTTARIVRVTMTGNNGDATVTDITGVGAQGPGPTVAFSGGTTLFGGNAANLPPGSGLTSGATYSYAYSIVDAAGEESAMSPAASITLGIQNQVTITLPAGLPASLVASARGWKIYRLNPDGKYYAVGSPLFPTMSFKDTLTDKQVLDQRPIVSDAPTTILSTAPHADARAMAFLPGTTARCSSRATVDFSSSTTPGQAAACPTGNRSTATSRMSRLTRSPTTRSAWSPSREIRTTARWPRRPTARFRGPLSKQETVGHKPSTSSTPEQPARRSTALRWEITSVRSPGSWITPTELHLYPERPPR